MASPSSLESFQALYSNLSALSEKKFPNLDRLSDEVEAHIQYFRALLDKKARNAASRQGLATGKLIISEIEYEINGEFQQGALQLADEVDLDEIEAAKIFLEAQPISVASERPVLTEAIIIFHQQRKYILGCLRLLLQLSQDVDLDEDIKLELQKFLGEQVIAPHNSTSTARYVSRCLAAMADIKAWLQRLSDKKNGASVLGQTGQPDVLERIEYERVSLIKQHEALGVILVLLDKGGHSKVEDFHSILQVLRTADKYDNILVHYIPATSAYITRFGAYGGDVARGDINESRLLNDNVMNPDASNWNLIYVRAAIRVLWLAEYSSWYVEGMDNTVSEIQLETEMKQRSVQFMEALKDGAFDFILALSADVKSIEWQDPARHALRQWLQRKAPALISDSVLFEDQLQELLMEQLESFVETFITNLPDVLRKLRVDEDQQRQLSKEHEHDLDLERFIVIISYTFEKRPKAAQEGFWDSPDSALHGFMHWASRRASTPLVSAFCEMLQALSEGEDNATSAHDFLLDEGSQTSSKMRRTHSLTWNQIFKELTFFSSKIRDRPALPQQQAYRPGKPHSDLEEAEPESVLMLESYLRLITRLCTESGVARQFLSSHPSFHLVELLFQLASSAIMPRLRACVFATLTALLSHKTKETSDFLWNALDYWVSGGYSTGTSMAKAAPVSTSQSSMQAILGGLTSGFEEPNLFIQFLHALVSPYEGGSGLHDDLPFPEQLGGASRMPGIDPYVDFALGQIFAVRSPELGDVTKVRLLQLTCLDFIATCLDTFNENLVIFASDSNLSVDNAIAASSLQDYVLLHPFSRVMEWMFNEKVMKALFASIHHDHQDVASVAPDSPLILCILQGIHVITSILELQPTYLDIIRPLIRTQLTSRGSPVASAAFTSFEDGILNHLSIVPDLGLLCGTGHPNLVIASLKLLQILSASPKLSTAPSAMLGGGIGRNKALAALDDDAETISNIMLVEMETNIDFGEGFESSPTYIIKIQILEFLITSLRTSPLRPSIAHRLLGFQCARESLSIDQNGPFDQGVSLFHSILKMSIDCPIGDQYGVLSGLVSLSYKSRQVLRELWASPLSSEHIMPELRVENTLSLMFIKETTIQSGMLWDGLNSSDPSFMSHSSASCFSDYLSSRTLMLQYSSAELRLITKFHSPSTKQKVLETILGSTTIQGGEKIDHSNIFDLFDFMGLEYGTQQSPQNSSFQEVDFLSCSDNFHSPSTYDLAKVEEYLILRRSELVNLGRLQDAQEMNIFNADAHEWMELFKFNNKVHDLRITRVQVLGAWVQLALVVIGSGDFDNTSKTSYVLRTLQTIMPVLEGDLDAVPAILELAKLAKVLIFALDFKSDAFKQGDMGELVSDRLFHLFQISIRAISLLGAKSDLKEIFYNISYHYLISMSDVTGISGISKRHSIQTIKSVGERFVDVVCDDAYAGEPTCRIAALLLLGSLVKLGKNENSGYIVDSLIRLNFIGILVDSLKTMSDELRETRPEDVSVHLSNCHARLSLLLQISQTRTGATAILNSGLFHLIKQSGLFSTDPDLGVDIDGPDALSKHYDLLSAIMRVICATLLSRGANNEQSLDQGRRFLTENRLSILAVLKKSAGLGAGQKASEESINELAECFMLLINVTGFLDFEEEASKKRHPRRAFT